ncbi:gp19, partial [Salmonella enterica subsp. enterica serovar Braenderup str. ATCC BAA-664]
PVANMAESYKPELAEGSGRAQTCRMVIIVSSVESVALSIDSTMVMGDAGIMSTTDSPNMKNPVAILMPLLKKKGLL